MADATACATNCLLLEASVIEVCLTKRDIQEDVIITHTDGPRSASATSDRMATLSLSELSNPPW